eukprot:GHUV01041390.1.p1 GENE.GHUV01041390.1~~GHUV01041390.1.p1  ORF type:complete len:113 (-),score=11.31 GHUV01041390.1:1576-1914(-)
MPDNQHSQTFALQTGAGDPNRMPIACLTDTTSQTRASPEHTRGRVPNLLVSSTLQTRAAPITSHDRLAAPRYCTGNLLPDCCVCSAAKTGLRFKAIMIKAIMMYGIYRTARA